MRAAAFEYFATSSMAIVRPRMPAPPPPYSSGMHRPVSPVSTNSANRSSGYFSVSSISRARGATRSCASLRTVAWSSASSSESSKSTTGDATGRYRPFGPALRGLAPLADETTALALGPTTPHAVLLAHGKGVLEAWLAHRTLVADLLGLRRVVLVGDGIEDCGIDSAAAGLLTPGQIHGFSTSSPARVSRGNSPTLCDSVVIPHRSRRKPPRRPAGRRAIGSAGWPGSPPRSSTPSARAPSGEAVS